jgi:hypothetical protein
MKRLLLLLLFVCSSAFGADVIQSNRKFKVPFTVDGKYVVNSAVVQGDILTVHFVKGDDILVVAYKLVPQVDPGPGPDPGPDPDPDPLPPVPTVLFGVVIEEQSTRTAEHAIVLGSQRVRAAFGEGNFRVEDKDVTGPDGKPPAGMVPYLDRAKDKVLPYFMVVDKATGKVFYEGALPKTVDELLKLVGKGGAK